MTKVMNKAINNTARLTTVTPQWWSNVVKSRLNGTMEHCFWLNGWTPTAHIDTLEVYFEGLLVMKGSVILVHKDTPENLYNDYKNSLGSIGLPKGSSYNHFENLLKKPFKIVPIELGNVVFTIEEINETVIKHISKERLDELNLKSIPTTRRSFKGKVEYC